MQLINMQWLAMYHHNGWQGEHGGHFKCGCGWRNLGEIGSSANGAEIIS